MCVLSYQSYFFTKNVFFYTLYPDYGYPSQSLESQILLNNELGRRIDAPRKRKYNRSLQTGRNVRDGTGV